MRGHAIAIQSSAGDSFPSSASIQKRRGASETTGEREKAGVASRSRLTLTTRAMRDVWQYRLASTISPKTPDTLRWEYPETPQNLRLIAYKPGGGVMAD